MSPCEEPEAKSVQSDGCKYPFSNATSPQKIGTECQLQEQHWFGDFRVCGLQLQTPLKGLGFNKLNSSQKVNVFRFWGLLLKTVRFGGVDRRVLDANITQLND